MIYKSYLVEENLAILKNNLVLIYGENGGLINELKEKILKNEKENFILRFTQDEIINNQNSFLNEINNKSLFAENKIFFINGVTDRIIKIIETYRPDIEKNKIYFFASLLDKKSKIRNYFEKDKKTDVIPCYRDDEIGSKKKLLKELKNYTGINTFIINKIIDNCSYDRSKLNNELEKIKSYFLKKEIVSEDLEKLLNLKEDEEFNIISNSALNGKIKETNKLLSSTIIETEKLILYLSLINNRLTKLKNVVGDISNLSRNIDKIKPPIFWKDKPNFINQAKKWNIIKINQALVKTFDIELKIKSNSSLNKNIIIKKLLIDICILANAA